MIDNTAKIPAVVPDSEVVLENGYPDWEKHLIMAQLRIETATPEGHPGNLPSDQGDLPPLRR